MNSTTPEPGPIPRPQFVTTHWSVVLSARDHQDTPSQQALENLCRTYWYPLYAFVRRQGHSPHDAQDLTQEFFSRLVEHDYLKSVAPEKGRFRTFLLVALKRFLANEWDKLRAQKRGGGQSPISLDTSAAETRYDLEPSQPLNADTIYDRRWAMTLLDQAMSKLRQEFAAAGKEKEFNHLKIALAADQSTLDYSQLSRELNQTEPALRVAVHRLRKRFREIFRDAISQTVSSPAEIEPEMRHLLAALAE